MDKYRAAACHLASGVVGLAAIVIGSQWVHAAGEPAALPATIIILALVALTPLAVSRSWQSRNNFLDGHVRAAARFLASVGVAAAFVIGLPGLVAWFLPAGTVAWTSVLVLPYAAAVALPVTWAFLAVRAAVVALQGHDDPYPGWTVAGAGHRSAAG